MMIRQKHGIAATDFVIFQPTRVSRRKNITRALRLASQLEDRLKPKKVFLIVAGGKEVGERKRREKEGLKFLARKFRFSNLIFLGNITPIQVVEYMRASNLVTFLSTTESFGRIPAESCLAGVPCLTTSYCDENGQPVFNTVYRGFKFLVEPDPNSDRISEANFRKILRLVRNPTVWNSNAWMNKKLVERYNRDHWQDTVQKLVDES